MHERLWDELGRIDYFLEQLARAVERGEVPLASYEALAPRYLERRAEIVSVIEGARSRRSGLPTEMPAERTIPERAAVLIAAPDATPEVPAESRPAGVPTTSRAPGLSWTTALVVTGAFLVIVAAAVFAHAAWQLASPLVRVGFLGALTAAFFAAGERVRTRLGLKAGGVALTVVGSAMLLFDGWIIIDGYGLRGPWPWAAWLLVCSLIYWLLEVRISGGFFGVIGVAAQGAWWWLAGEGLGWDPTARIALTAAVMAAWAHVARRVPADSQLTPLAHVLGLAAPAGAALMAVLFVPQLSFALTAVEIACAAVVGWSVTLAFMARRLPPWLGALGHVPVVLALLTGPEPGWWLVAILVGNALAAGLYELARGGVTHGVIDLISEVACLVVVADLLDWGSEGWIIAFTFFALYWGLGALLLRQMERYPQTEGLHWRGYAAAAETGAWLVIAVVSVALPTVVPLPLAGFGGTPWNGAGISAGVALGWLGLSLVLRRPGTLPSAVVSLFALAGALDAADVSWSAPLLGLALLAMAGLWSLAVPLGERLARMPRDLMLLALRGIAGLIALVALAADLVLGDFPSAEAAVLLAALAVWYAIDALLSRSEPVWAAASVPLVAAAGVAGAWLGEGNAAALSGAGAAVSVTTLGWLVRVHRGLGSWAALAAPPAALIVVALSLPDPWVTAVALAVCAIALTTASGSSGLIEGLGGAGVLFFGAALGLVAHLDASAWATVAVAILLAAALVVPLLLASREMSRDRARASWALAAAGAHILAAACILGWGQTMFGFERSGWLGIGGHGFAVVVGALGAYLLAIATRRKIETAVYAGAGLLLAAYWIEIGQGDFATFEWYSTPGALYLAWCGYRWASHSESRTVPLLSDLAAVFVGLVLPALLVLDFTLTPAESWTHTFWAFGLGVAAMALGVLLRVRAYFFGGIAVVVFTALVRSWDYLTAYWWAVLGIAGTGMIVIALAREFRDRTFSSVRDALATWR